MVILQRKVKGLSAESLERFVRHAQRAAGLKGTVNILVTSSAAVRSLNRRFRKKDKATDVLSFPAVLSRSGGRTHPVLAGDIVICAEIASESGAVLGHSPGEEVKVLALHGILHLAGFDHERDNGRMARREASLRRLLALPHSLTERACSASLASPGRRSRTRTKGRRKTA